MGGCGTALRPCRSRQSCGYRYPGVGVTEIRALFDAVGARCSQGMRVATGV